MDMWSIAATNFSAALFQSQIPLDFGSTHTWKYATVNGSPHVRLLCAIELQRVVESVTTTLEFVFC